MSYRCSSFFGVRNLEVSHFIADAHHVHHVPKVPRGDQERLALSRAWIDPGEPKKCHVGTPLIHDFAHPSCFKMRLILGLTSLEMVAK